MHNNNHWKYGSLLVLLVALPFVLSAIPGLGGAWVRIAGFAMLYAMLALGLNVVVGYAGLLDLGYIAFYAVGAYVYALLASPHLFQAGLTAAPLDWPLWAIVPVAAVAAGVTGVLLGAPTLRLRGDYLAIVTLGFGEIIRIFIVNLDRPYDITSGAQGIGNIQPLHLGGVSLKTAWQLGPLTVSPVINYYLVFLAIVVLLVAMSRRLEDSRIGRAWMALREDETAAEAMGLNKRNLKLLAFSMGATFGGVSGVLFASYQQFVSPESFVLGESTMVLAMVVLGGMGSIPGVVCGAVILAVMPEVLRDTIEAVHPWVITHITVVSRDVWLHVLDAGTIRMLLFGLALVLMMRYRPHGLWPKRQTQRGASVQGAAPEEEAVLPGMPHLAVETVESQG